MSMFWNISNGENGQTVSIIFSDGTSETITDQHVSFNPILEKIRSVDPIDTPEVVESFVRSKMNVIEAVTEKLTKLSDKIYTDGRNIYYDGDIVDSSISKYILESFKRDLGLPGAPNDSTSDHWTSLVAFLEKIQKNPSKTAVNGLFVFLRKYGLRILPDGNFIAFKGLRGDFTSIHKGFGIVNSVPQTSNLANDPGNKLEFPRSEVVEDGSIGCAKGLHAGSIEYATNFSKGKVVSVSIDPGDVVSVPTDCADQKIRTCRYTVMLEIPQTYVNTNLSHISAQDIHPDYDEDNDYDVCEYCNYEDCECELCENCGEDFYCECDDETELFISEGNSDLDTVRDNTHQSGLTIRGRQENKTDYSWRPGM